MTAYPNVALCGKLRSGKSEVARYLAEKYGYTEFAFGDELKHMAHEIFDVPETPKPRGLYQSFGQAMRSIDPDVWVRKCFDVIAWYANERAAFSESLCKHSAHLTPAPLRPLISDLRQPNELARCRAEGYVIVRVNAPEELRRERAEAEGDAFDSASLTHETEQHVDLFAVDYDVYNTGTIDGLHAQIDAIMRSFAKEDTV